MKQILHIFVKDTRRFWPEILISLAIVAALVYAYPHQWTVTVYNMQDPSMDLLGRFEMLSGIFSALVPLGWFVLIARLIHAESLVGDRQNWLTRPYRWPQLLAAKFLFLAIFLYVPLVVAQSILLSEAGIDPLSTLPGMLFNLLLLTGLVVLPTVAIATVTSSFIRMFFVLIAIVIGLAVYAVPASGVGLVDNSVRSLIVQLGRVLSPSHILHSSAQLPTALLLGVISCAVVVLQYARRREWISRMILLGVPVLLGCINLLAPTSALSGQTRLNRDYPPQAVGEPALIDLAIAHPPAVSRWTAKSDMADLFFFLHVSGISSENALKVDQAKLTIQGSDGFQWSGRSIFFSPFSESNRQSYLSVDLPISVYSRLQASPVTLRITLAAEQLHAEKQTSVPLSTQQFTVPDYGVCATAPQRGGATIFSCRSAFREPTLTRTTIEKSEAPCPASQTELMYMGGNEWSGLMNSEPAELGIGPIMFSMFGFEIHQRDMMGKHLCTGAPVTFTQYKAVRHVQTTVTIPNVQLTALR